jgi:hypothetical protein
MTPELDKAFVTAYLLSLKERTRSEQSGVKWGIDWLVYNLGQALYGKPVRLPFLRQSDPASIKTKTEAEFGIDLSFLSVDGQTLTIFVLKDEQLSNKTWVANGFLEDLSKAATPDLQAQGMEAVRTVQIILAYNRDEDANGISLFDRFVAAANPLIAGHAKLTFARWNLSDLVDLTLRHLLTPALVPQQFFGQLNYLCAQISRFPHGSDEWEKQLVPGWKRFVADVLALDHGARGVSLIPVALIILRQHGTTNRTLETGWIDLIEWTAIPMWLRFVDSTDETVRGQVYMFWNVFYLNELDRFYRAHIQALGTKHAIDQLAHGSMVGTVATAMVAHWHMARIGLLSVGRTESMPDNSAEERRRGHIALQEAANWMVQLLNANDSCLRPILDIHHIELALLLFTLSNANRLEVFSQVLPSLVQHLFLRRIERSEIPFLDGHNSLDNFFEQVATGGVEKLVLTESSFYVLMLFECACALDDKFRDENLGMFHRRLVLGAMDSGPQENLRPLHLMSWIPPEGWDKRVLEGYVEDGDVVSRGPFAASLDAPAAEIHAAMTQFVSEMRKARVFPDALRIPLGPLLLASLRHRSPLPPELWRNAAFPEDSGGKNPV